MHSGLLAATHRMLCYPSIHRTQVRCAGEQRNVRCARDATQQERQKSADTSDHQRHAALQLNWPVHVQRVSLAIEEQNADGSPRVQDGAEEVRGGKKDCGAARDCAHISKQQDGQTKSMGDAGTPQREFFAAGQEHRHKFCLKRG